MSQRANSRASAASVVVSLACATSSSSSAGGGGAGATAGAASAAAGVAAGAVDCVVATVATPASLRDASTDHAPNPTRPSAATAAAAVPQRSHGAVTGLP